MDSEQPGDELNWVDPDILAHYRHNLSKLDRDLEQSFKRFFISEWPGPQYDDLRERWDPLITDPDPRNRLYGKTALWTLVQYRKVSRNANNSYFRGHDVKDNDVKKAQ